MPALAGEWFVRHDIQIYQAYGNVPSATSEDGTSAGIAVAAALVKHPIKGYALL